MAAPTLPCPSWCGITHDPAEEHNQHHMTHRPIGGTGWMTLIMTDYCRIERFNGEIHLHLHWKMTTSPKAAIIRPLSEAGEFAELAEAFGRPDIAVVIRELAALAVAPVPA